MEWSENHYKLLQMIEKIFADLFVYSDADFDMHGKEQFIFFRRN